MKDLLEKRGHRSPRGESGARGARTARPKGRSRLLFWTLLALAGPLVAGVGGWLSPVRRALDREVFALRSICVLGAGRLSAEEIAAKTGLAEGTSLFEISPREIEGRLRKDPWIREAAVMRLVPGRLLVKVALREPVARVTAASAEVGSPGMWVDAEGRAIAQAAGEPLPLLPIIVSPRLPAVGEVEPAVGAAAAAVGAVARSNFATTSATFFLGAENDPNSVSLKLPQLSARVLVGTGDLDQKIARLALVLAGESTPARAAAEIDLRFADRAVLRGLPLPDGTAHSAQAPGGAPAPHDRAG
jgi:cell division septal protein FtsQ